jgi:hypothetical protein
VLLIYAELFISLTDRDNDVKLLSASDFTVKLSHCQLEEGLFASMHTMGYWDWAENILKGLPEPKGHKSAKYKNN